MRLDRNARRGEPHAKGNVDQVLQKAGVRLLARVEEPDAPRALRLLRLPLVDERAYRRDR